MSSSSSSSSGTGAKSPSRLPPRSSRIRAWGAAALTAAALYALPLFLFVAAFGPRWAIAVVTVAVAVLVYAAIRIWSPLVTLALAVLAGISFAAWWLIVAMGNTCGDSRAAGAVEGVGTIAIPVTLTAWQLRRGRAVFWAIPLGAVLGGVWYVVWAHVIPGGAGGCFE